MRKQKGLYVQYFVKLQNNSCAKIFIIYECVRTLQLLTCLGMKKFNLAIFNKI